MLQQTTLDTAKELLELGKELLPLLSGESINKAIAGIEEAKDIIKDKNESIAARDEAAKLVAGIEKREAIVAEKESAIKATQEGLAFADVGLKNLRKSLDEREDALNKLQEKLNKAQANLEKLLAENEVKAADLASLSKEAEATKKQYADKLAALSKLEA